MNGPVSALLRSLLWSALSVALAAQQEVPPAATTAQLLQQLGERGLDPATAAPLVDALLPAGESACIAAANLVRQRIAEAARAFPRDRDRLLRPFAREVSIALRRSQGRGAETKIADRRDRARAITRAADLSKQRIRDELDPLLAELTELTLVTPAQIVAGNPRLEQSLRELRDSLSEWTAWSRLHARLAAELEQTDGGRSHLQRFPAPAEPPDPSFAIDAELEIAALSGLPLSNRDQKALLANAALRTTMDPEEFAGTLALNRIRIALGLGVVAIDEKLATAAREHSDDMRRLGFFSHESPVPGKRTFGERASRAGTSASAENIAAGQATGPGAIRAWWYSPGHHKNMLGGHSRTGLGRSGGTWTQMFGG